MRGLRIDGCCYALPRGAGLSVITRSDNWAKMPDDRWETEIATEARATLKLGSRQIDGAPCMVFKCDDGRVRAIVMAAARAAEEKVGGREG